MVQGVSNRKAWAGNGPCGLLHVKLWEFGTEGCKYTGASVQSGVPNHHAEERREMANLRSQLKLFPGPNHESLSNPSGVQSPGVLVLQPGQFAKTQPKGLPEWVSVTIQLWRNFVPRKLQNLPGKTGK